MDKPTKNSHDRDPKAKMWSTGITLYYGLVVDSSSMTTNKILEFFQGRGYKALNEGNLLSFEREEYDIPLILTPIPHNPRYKGVEVLGFYKDWFPGNSLKFKSLNSIKNWVIELMDNSCAFDRELKEICKLCVFVSKSKIGLISIDSECQCDECFPLQ